MRLLLAEDDNTSRKLLTHVLQGWNYEVIPVCDGARAWDALGGEAPPPMAILDWEMPGLDGVEVCRLVRRLDTPSPPYIILLTARTAKEDIVVGLDAGANDFLTKPFHREELRARVEVGRRFVELNHELLESRERLRIQACTDALTGVMNRRAVLETLETTIEKARADGNVVAVGMMDIDHFKRVNDTLGHAGGDEVLREVVLRSADVLREDDALGRFGGEEFLLILVGPGASSFRPVLERVRRAVAHSPVRVAEHVVQVTVSIGGVIGTGQSIDELIRDADDALYAAKARGRNQVVLAGAPRRGAGLATAGRRAGGAGA